MFEDIKSVGKYFDENEKESLMQQNDLLNDELKQTQDEIEFSKQMTNDIWELYAQQIKMVQLLESSAKMQNNIIENLRENNK